LFFISCAQCRVAKAAGIRHDWRCHFKLHAAMEPHRRSRWVIYKQGPLLALIGLMVAIFLVQELVGPVWYYPFMAVPAKVVAGWQHLRAGTGGAADWRAFGTLWSCAFLHADIGHILFNMLYLWIFAALAADLLGQRWMLAIFLVTAGCGSLCHTLLNVNSMAPMLGASGAVMGFEGAYLGLTTRWHLPEPHVWPMSRSIPPGQLALLALFGVAMDYANLMNAAGSRVAFGAHIGGFTAGLFLTALVAPKPVAARPR
jgi:membrane associated rhomboid family serine protease